VFYKWGAGEIDIILDGVMLLAQNRMPHLPRLITAIHAEILRRESLATKKILKYYKSDLKLSNKKIF
jgi:hypothetical protein